MEKLIKEKVTRAAFKYNYVTEENLKKENTKDIKFSALKMSEY